MSTTLESTTGVIIEDKEGPECEMIFQLKEKFHCTDRWSEKNPDTDYFAQKLVDYKNRKGIWMLALYMPKD